jgi:hypothetical protein
MESLQSVQHRKLDQSTVNIRPDLGKPEIQDAESYHASSEVLHPAHEAAEPKHAGVERSRLNPVDVPPPNAHASNRAERVEAVCDFVGRIAVISDGEYGDWSRRATLYWWHLTEALHGENNPGIRNTLQEMMRIIEFNPDFRILETSRKVTQLAMNIREMLGVPMRPEETLVSQADRSTEAPVPDYSLRVSDPKKPKVESVVGGPNSQGFIGKG